MFVLRLTLLSAHTEDSLSQPSLPNQQGRGGIEHLCPGQIKLNC